MRAAGSAALVLVDRATPLRPESALFEAMLEGWRRQQSARRLSGPLIEGRVRLVPAADLAPKPAAVDHVMAAAVPLGALTAWQALHEHAQLRPGQHVLVHGGAGGVGGYAVPLAALHGARVTATASARDLAFVTRLGAHNVLDYTRRFEDQIHDVDVVIDPVGGDTTARSWPVMRSGATLAAIAEEPIKGERGRDDVRAVYFVVEPDGGQLRELAALVDKQQLHPLVSVVFGLTALPEAFRALRAARAPGKVVVSIDKTAGRQAMQRPASPP